MLIAGHSYSGNKSAIELVHKTPHFYNVVALSNVGHTMAKDFFPFAASYLHLEFDDIVRVVEGMTAPSISHVETVLGWVEGKSDLLFACHAGVSRSSALAVVTAENRGEDWTKFLDYKRHFPNQRIIRIGAKILGKPDLLTRMDQWKLIASAMQGHEDRFY